MKKKVSINHGHTILVDYQQQRNIIENLQKKKLECEMHRDYVGAAKCLAKMNDELKKLQYLETQQQITLGDLVRERGEKERLKFTALSIQIMLLADLLDSTATDLQSQMVAIGSPQHLNVMYAVKDIKKNAEAFVRMFSSVSDDACNARFGELGDSVYNYIQMRANTFAKNEIRRNNLKI